MGEEKQVEIVEAEEKKPSKMGRPTKFDITVRDKIMALVATGKTDKQIAQEIGVAESTFHLWKQRFPDFSESLRSIKDIQDDLVESALLANATLFNYTTAQIFWLKNRRPREWRDKVDVAVEPIDEMEF